MAQQEAGSVPQEGSQPTPPSSSATPGAPEAEAGAKNPQTVAPELLTFQEAELGPDAPALDQTREVLLELTVSTDGSVADVSVIEGTDAALDAAAKTAVEGFKFKPATVNGTPTAVRIRYRYVFEPLIAPEEPTANGAEAQDVSAAKAAETAAPSHPKLATPTGKLEGQVLQRGTRKPIVGASVKLPKLGLETLTDAEGRFRFEDVPVGPVALVLQDAEHASIEDQQEILKAQSTSVVYYAEQTSFGEDDLVSVGRKIKKEVSHHTLSVEELNTVPGSNGDALKGVQNLPGVARTNSFATELILRGGGVSNVYANGFPIASAFHFGGLRSTVGNGLLGSLEVVPGNYSARYGRGNGGVIDIQMRRPAADGLHGFAQVDLFDASLFVEGPVTQNSTFAIGGRRSYIDTLLPLFLNDEGKRVFQNAPRYYDAQAAYDWESGPNRFRTNLYFSQDSMELLFEDPPETDPSIRDDLRLGERFLTAQVIWDTRIGSDTTHMIGLSYLNGRSEQFVGRDFQLEFTGHAFSFREELQHQVSPWLTARGGIDAELEHIEFDVKAPLPPKEGEPQDPLSTQEPLVVDGTATVTRPALWAATDIQLGPLLLVPSLRADYFSRPDNLKGSLELQPRFSVRWAVAERTTLKGAVGWYSEGANIDESNAVFGNPKINPSLSRQYSAGVEQQLTDALSLDVTGFYKDLYEQISRVDDPEQKFDNTGVGRSYGSEVLLRHSGGSRFYGWAAYTLMRSERKDAGAQDYRLFDSDQTHNLTLVGQYRLSPTWELGSRFRYVSGNPYTPPVGATYDSDADTYLPIYGEVNSKRDGAFHQLDVRVDKHFIFDTWRLTAYLDVQNIYNRANPEGRSYNYDYSESKTSAGLPLIPSFGVKGAF